MLQFEDAVPPNPGLGLQQAVADGMGVARPGMDTHALAAPRVPELSDTAKLRRVNLADKRMINGQTDVNQLVPFKYKWAWEKYLSACANHWMPQEIQMSRDIELWKNPHGLTDDERRLVIRTLGFFVTADGGVAETPATDAKFCAINDPECEACQ